MKRKSERVMDDESGESMEPMEEVPLNELGDAQLERLVAGSVEESIRMTEDRDKWRKYVHGVANPRIEDGQGTGTGTPVHGTGVASGVC